MARNQLKIMLKPMADGSLLPLLCDRSGEPLPGQVRVVIEVGADEVTRVTATFGAVDFA